MSASANDICAEKNCGLPKIAHWPYRGMSENTPDHTFVAPKQ